MGVIKRKRFVKGSYCGLKWFINRLKAGFVYIKNPMNANQVSRVELNTGVVDCIVFWSKNPEPLVEKLDFIDELGYKYYFQFSITPYNSDIETGLVNKRRIIETFIRLSDKIGKEKVVWRYDPIILNDQFPIEFHIDSFYKMAGRLSEYADECIISFVDPYKKTNKYNIIRDITESEMKIIADEFSKIAAEKAMIIKTCAEGIDLSKYNIQHASCIDRNRIESIIGAPLHNKVKKDGQRKNCGCIECIDVGAYNTCKNGCLYCYATFNQELADKNYNNHFPDSPLLVGHSEGIKVTERKVKSLKEIDFSFS
jgi:protein-arginine kinase activator protein McsA